jgi:hypothetical protein
MNVALFISGRLLGYDICLLPLVNRFSKEYNIKVFFSINTLSLGKGENMDTIITHLKQLLGDRFGDIYYEEFKLPYDYVQTKLQNGIDIFLYNQLSCFYNDKQNLRLIEDYQRNHNITFDVISKIRSDIFPVEHCNCIYLMKDTPDTLNIQTVCHFIRYWGHEFKDFPYPMISDAFAYGNMKSMRIYCKTYDWILEQSKLRNGRYIHTFEILLTDSIIDHCVYDHDDGHNNPTISETQLLNIFVNNSNYIKISYIDVEYHLMPLDMRSKNNFIVDKTNVLNYTQPRPE